MAPRSTRLTVVLALALIAPCNATEAQCEMCGLLVYHLEKLKAGMDEEMAAKKAEHDAQATKRGVLGRTSRAEMPARVIGAFETFLDETACGKIDASMSDGEMQSPFENKAGVSSEVCRRDGMDDSVLRKPNGEASAFDARSCVLFVSNVCHHVREEFADEMIEAAYSPELGAPHCAEIVDGCDSARATKLLGPLYKPGGGQAGFQRFASVGVKDVWQKMPGLPPYYHNRARHISQVEPPEGWDPDGPREQSLVRVETSKDEL